jgi:hypothetical protein
MAATLFCDHCRTKINPTGQSASAHALRGTNGTGAMITWVWCPECNQIMIDLSLHNQSARRIYPRAAVRPKAPHEVPEGLANDYNEACLVLPDSAMSAAALGRRCLQHLLREHAAVKHGSLDREIQQVLDEQRLPSFLAEAIDAIRVVGNFAAHPIKSEHSGEVVPVEPGEAEWTLDTVEQLFDFYFVAPAVLAAKRAELNQKLADVGKPPLK